MNSITFSNPEVTATARVFNTDEERSSSADLALEIFGEQTHSPKVTSWLPIILDKANADVRSGLQEEI